MGRCQDISVGRNQRSLFGAPGLSQIGGSHELEVPSWDLRRPLSLDNIAGPPPSAGFQIRAHAIDFCLFLRLLTQICGLTDCNVAPKFSHDSGPDWLSSSDNSHEATIEVTCCIELRKMIIAVIINVKPAVKWVSRIHLALHLS